jgi:hypothetical protein
MITDNFEQITNLLTFESEDDFYHLQILMRKKDLSEHFKARNNNSRCIKTYYIKNKEYLLEKKPEIVKLCELFTARAYINLNKKSFKKASLQLIAEVTNRIINHQDDYIYRAYESVVGDKKVNIGEKRWIIDVDTKDMDKVLDLGKEICKCKSAYGTGCDKEFKNIITHIPTVYGWHIITHPFNLKQIEPYRCLNPFDVQKNNPTLLYFNNNRENKRYND